jgi:hypothetical protein
MHKARIGLLLVLGVLLASCNAVPPTLVVMMITNTPDPRVVAVTVTPTGAPATTQATAQPPTVAPTAGAVATSSPPSSTPVVLPPTTGAVPTAVFGPTQTLSAFPTETRSQLYIAQQDFQHGFMFWVSTQKVIWVLFNDVPPDNGKSGEWQSYPDTFVDGEQEMDPALTPPSATLYQPKRGFGKLWRTTPEVKDKLGWATTPEFALTTTYVYQPGGYLDGNGKYVPRPGKHFITSLSRQTFALSEPDQPNTRGRWERVS